MPDHTFKDIATDVESKLHAGTKESKQSALDEVDDFLKQFTDPVERQHQWDLLTQQLDTDGTGQHSYLPELLIGEFGGTDKVYTRYDLLATRDDPNSDPLAALLAGEFLKRFDQIETADNAQWNMRAGETDGRAGDGALIAWAATHVQCQVLENGSKVYTDGQGHVTEIEEADGKRVTFMYDSTGALTEWTNYNGDSYVKEGDVWHSFDKDGAQLGGQGENYDLTDLIPTGGNVAPPGLDGTFRWTDNGGNNIEYSATAFGTKIVSNENIVETFKDGQSVSFTVDANNQVSEWTDTAGNTFKYYPLENSWHKYNAIGQQISEQDINGNVVWNIVPNHPPILSTDGSFNWTDNAGTVFDLHIHGDQVQITENDLLQQNNNKFTQVLPDGSQITRDGDKWYHIVNDEKTELSRISIVNDGGKLTLKIRDENVIANDGSYILKTATGSTEHFDSNGVLTEVDAVVEGKQLKVTYSFGQVSKVENLTDGDFWSYDTIGDQSGWQHHAKPGTEPAIIDAEKGFADLINFRGDVFADTNGLTFNYHNENGTVSYKADSSSLDIGVDSEGKTEVFLKDNTLWHQQNDGSWTLEDKDGKRLGIAVSGQIDETSGNLRLVLPDGSQLEHLPNGNTRLTQMSGSFIDYDAAGIPTEATLKVPPPGQDIVLMPDMAGGWRVYRRDGSALQMQDVVLNGTPRFDQVGFKVVTTDGEEYRILQDGGYVLKNIDGSMQRFDQNNLLTESYDKTGELAQSYSWDTSKQPPQLIGITDVNPEIVWAVDPNNANSWLSSEKHHPSSAHPDVFYVTATGAHIDVNGTELHSFTVQKQDNDSQLTLNDAHPPQITDICTATGIKYHLTYDSQTGALTKVEGPQGSIESADGKFAVDPEGNITYQVSNETQWNDLQIVITKSILANGWELTSRNGVVVGTDYDNGPTHIHRHFDFAPNGDVASYTDEQGRTFQIGNGLSYYQGNDLIAHYDGLRFDGAGNLITENTVGTPPSIVREVTSPNGWNYEVNPLSGDLLKTHYLNTADSTFTGVDSSSITIQTDPPSQVTAWVFHKTNGPDEAYVLGSDSAWHLVTKQDDNNWSAPAAEPALLNIVSSTDGRIFRALPDGTVQVIGLDGSVQTSSSHLIMSAEALEQRAAAIHGALFQFHTDSTSACDSLSGMTLADRMALDATYLKLYGHHLLSDLTDRGAHDSEQALAIAELFRFDDTKPDDKGQIDRAFALLNIDYEAGEIALRNIFAVLTKAQIDDLRANAPDLFLQIQNNPLISEYTKEAIAIYSNGRDFNFAANGYLKDDVATRLGELAYQAKDYMMFAEAMRVASKVVREEMIAEHPDLSTAFGEKNKSYVDDFIYKGEISLTSLVDGNCHPGYHNKDAISADMLNAPADQQQLFTRGFLLIQNGVKSSNNPDDQKAIEYYKELHAALERAGVIGLVSIPSDVAKWEAQLMYGNSIISELLGSTDTSSDKILPMIENMSAVDVRNLVTPVNGRFVFQEQLYAALDLMYPDKYSYTYFAAKELLNEKIAAYQSAVTMNHFIADATAVENNLSRITGIDLTQFVTLHQLDPVAEAAKEGQRSVLDVMDDSLWQAGASYGSKPDQILTALLNMSLDELAMLRGERPMPAGFSIHHPEMSGDYFALLKAELHARFAIYPGGDLDMLDNILERIHNSKPGTSVRDALGPFADVMLDILKHSANGVVAHDLQIALQQPGALAQLHKDETLAIWVSAATDRISLAAWLRMTGPEQTQCGGFAAFTLAVHNSVFTTGELPINVMLKLDVHDMNILGVTVGESADAGKRTTDLLNMLTDATANLTSPSEMLRERALQTWLDTVKFVRDNESTLFIGLTDRQKDFLHSIMDKLENGGRISNADKLRLSIIGGGNGSADILPQLQRMTEADRLEAISEYARVYHSDLKTDVMNVVGDNPTTKLLYSSYLDSITELDSRQYVYNALFHYLEVASGFAANSLQDSTKQGAQMGYDTLAAATQLGNMSAEQIKSIYEQTEALITTYSESKKAFTENIETIVTTVLGLLAAPLAGAGLSALAAEKLAAAFIFGAVMRVGMRSALLGREYDSANVIEDSTAGGIGFLLNFIGPKVFEGALQSLGFGAKVASGAIERFGANVTAEGTALIELAATDAVLSGGGKVTARMMDDLALKLGLDDLGRATLEKIINEEVAVNFSHLSMQLIEKSVILTIGGMAGGISAFSGALFHLDPEKGFAEQVMPAIAEGIKGGVVGAAIFTVGITGVQTLLAVSINTAQGLRFKFNDQVIIEEPGQTPRYIRKGEIVDLPPGARIYDAQGRFIETVVNSPILQVQEELVPGSNTKRFVIEDNQGGKRVVARNAETGAWEVVRPDGTTSPITNFLQFGDGQLVKPTNGEVVTSTKINIDITAGADAAAAATIKAGTDNFSTSGKIYIADQGIEIRAYGDINDYNPALADQPVDPDMPNGPKFKDLKAFFDPETKTIVILKGATQADITEELWHALDYSMGNFSGSPAFRSMFSLESMNLHPTSAQDPLAYFADETNRTTADKEAFRQAADIARQLAAGKRPDQLTPNEQAFLRQFPVTVELVSQRLSQAGILPPRASYDLLGRESVVGDMAEFPIVASNNLNADNASPEGNNEPIPVTVRETDAGKKYYISDGAGGEIEIQFNKIEWETVIDHKPLDRNLVIDGEIEPYSIFAPKPPIPLDLIDNPIIDYQLGTVIKNRDGSYGWTDSAGDYWTSTDKGETWGRTDDYHTQGFRLKQTHSTVVDAAGNQFIWHNTNDSVLKTWTQGTADGTWDPDLFYQVFKTIDHENHLVEWVQPNGDRWTYDPTSEAFVRGDRKVFIDITNGSKVYELDPARNVYVAPDGATYEKGASGQYWSYPNGDHVWRTATGNYYLLEGESVLIPNPEGEGWIPLSGPTGRLRELMEAIDPSAETRKYLVQAAETELYTSALWRLPNEMPADLKAHVLDTQSLPWERLAATRTWDALANDRAFANLSGDEKVAYFDTKLQQLLSIGQEGFLNQYGSPEHSINLIPTTLSVTLDSRMSGALRSEFKSLQENWQIAAVNLAFKETNALGKFDRTVFDQKYDLYLAMGKDAFVLNHAPELLADGQPLNPEVTKLLGMVIRKTADMGVNDYYDQSGGAKAAALTRLIDPEQFDAAFQNLHDAAIKNLTPEELRLYSTDANDYAARGAAGLVLLFGDKFPEWLKKQRSWGRSDHDSVTWLFNSADWILQASSRERADFAKYLMNNANHQLNELELVARNWKELTPQERALPFDQVVQGIRRRTYPGAEDLAFAEQAAMWGVTQEDFPEFENRFLEAQDVPSPFPTERVWESNGLVGHFIPRSDPRGIFLGNLTNCCQHPYDAGAPCAWYGLENPNSGFFVVENAQGEIVAQSWAWVSDDGALVFDNIESKGLGKRKGDVVNIYESVASDLSEQYTKVVVGHKIGDLNDPPPNWVDAGANIENVPADYDEGYTDSTLQWVITKRVEVDPAATTEHTEPTFRALAEEDLPSLAPIVEERYKGEWQQIPFGNDSVGRVMETADGSPLGYAVWEPDNHHISDMAVSKTANQADKDAFALSIAGEILSGDPTATWTAEARELTAYPIILKLAQNNTIRITSDVVTIDVNGEPVHHVSFVPLPTDSTTQG